MFYREPMKVVDVMSRQVQSVSVHASVRDIAHLIFECGINGVPVCKGKKLVGFITERDILAKFYPSMQEYVEDFVHASDFEAMEEKVSEILHLTAEKIMSRNLITVTADTPLLRAQSLMSVHKVGRLPVVDEKDNLVGIISKGDIFRAIVGERLPLGEEEDFFDWMARYYDTFIDWEERLGGEIPALVRLFQETKVKKVLDIASSTGVHAITLAKKEFEVVGLESSSAMSEVAERKKEALPMDSKNRVTFLHGNYKTVLASLPEDFDAAMFMGNALSHVMLTEKRILEGVVKLLPRRNALLIFQIANYDKTFQSQRGLRDFDVRVSDKGDTYAFLTFYTKEKGAFVTMTRAIFELVRGKWKFRGINSTQVVHMTQQQIRTKLKKLGFGKVAVYGNQFYGLFLRPFKPEESDFFNIIAKR